MQARGLQGMPEVRAGDDLAQLITTAVVDNHLRLEDGDVLVVSSKVVSKAAGLVRPTPSSGRDTVVAAESVRLVASRRTPRGTSSIVQCAAGPVMAAAGVDASNTAAGTLLTLPPDPDGAARELRAALRSAGAGRIAVVVSDTAGRPWRRGQTDFALGCAGLVPVDDLRGSSDASGQVLEVTERALADEVAGLADLVKGKATGVPVALVRGLASYVTQDDGPGAASLLRDPASDWFRAGHVEAVRASLGVPEGSVEVPSVLKEPLQHKVRRAAEVALTAGPDVPRGLSAEVVDGEVVGSRGSVNVDIADAHVVDPHVVDPHSVDVAGADVAHVTIAVEDPFTAGVVVSRLRSALWAEDLIGAPRYDPATRTVRADVRSW